MPHATRRLRSSTTSAAGRKRGRGRPTTTRSDGVSDTTESTASAAAACADASQAKSSAGGGGTRRKKRSREKGLKRKATATAAEQASNESAADDDDDYDAEPPQKKKRRYFGQKGKQIHLADGSIIPAPRKPKRYRPIRPDTQHYIAHPGPVLSEAYKARAAASKKFADASDELGYAEVRLCEALEAHKVAEAAHKAAKTELKESTERVRAAELQDPNCSWNEMFGKLEKYVEDHHGSVEVPDEENFSEGSDMWKLSRWVRRQKEDEADMRRAWPHRYAALEQMGFEFRLPDDLWLTRYESLAKIKEETGSLRIPLHHPEQKVLCPWLSNHRAELRNYLDGKPSNGNYKLTPGKVRRLEAIGLHEDLGNQCRKWEDSYAALLAYKREFGHVKVPQKYVGPDGTRKLARFVTLMRCQYAAYKDGIDKRAAVKEKLMEKRIKRLDDIGFVWRIHKFKGHRSNKPKSK